MDKKCQTKVKVVIRVRPTLSDDSISCVNSSKSNNFIEIFNHRNKNENLQYDFSSVYDGTATQKEIFDECVEPLLENSFHGQNVSIFAYGPTGAGKTHTMLGSDLDPGIIPRVMKWLFERIDKDIASSALPDIPKTVINFSYLEIYNEKVQDLLTGDRNDLPIREDNKHNIFVAGLTEKTVDSFETFKSHLGPACNNRAVAATNLNEHSSRSHSIVMLKITRTDKDKEYIGKIHLIDLAGSEDNRRTGNKGIRLKESGAINKSLFVLGEVVDAINKNLGRIPYRNSKLTRLLQDSLGGSCHSLMVTNIAPEEHYYYDTYCTLNFASKSKKIVNTNTTTVNSLESLHKPLKRSIVSDSELVPLKKPRKQVSSITLAPADSSVSSNEHGPSPLKSMNERIEELEKQLQQFKDEKRMSEETRTSPVPSCRRSKCLSSSSPSSSVPSSSSDTHHSDSENRQELRGFKNSQLKLSLVPVDTDESPDIVCATPVIKKQKNALKDKSNMFLNMLGRPRHKIHDRIKRILDSGPSLSPLFPNFPSEKKKRHRKGGHTDEFDTPFGKSKAEEDSPGPAGSTWQEKRNSTFLKMLNDSSAKELQQLQTVGAKRAKLIFEWRELHGPFTEVEDLKEIPGISAKYFDKLLKNNLVTQ